MRSPRFPIALRRRISAPTPPCLALVAAATLWGCGGDGGATTGVAHATAVTTGAMSVTLQGLPAGTSPTITITGDGGFSRSLGGDTHLTALPAGSYTIAADDARSGPDRFGASPATQTVQVSAGATRDVTVAFRIRTGALAIGVAGLPGTASPTVDLSGPDGFRTTVAAGTSVRGLQPGTYHLTGAPITVGDTEFVPVQPQLDVVVAAADAPTPAVLPFRPATGSLQVQIDGLPADTPAPVVVTGTNGVSHPLAASTTLGGLPPGTYTVTAGSVTRSGARVEPSPATQSVTVAAGATATARIAYPDAPPLPPRPLNLTIEGMHVQQVVQTFDGRVPLVTGRPGLLRIFVRASDANTATPAVRVRLFQGATLASTVTIASPARSVPVASNERSLDDSWNYVIPAALMRPGLRILADVDPQDGVAETSESDNTFPASASPAVMDVRTPPPFALRLVPVLQATTGLQGAVSEETADAFLRDTRQLYPLDEVHVDVRAPFTTNAPPLLPNDANGAWSQVLSEVNALRVAEGSDRHYYGVVKVGYAAGIAGLGYTPGRSAIGWDRASSAAGIMAHEIGHNFGRFHAPGCGAQGADAAYPLGNGRLEAFGYDFGANALKEPAAAYDVMSYCTPTWISAYTYDAVLAYRASSPFSASAVLASRGAQRGLLVWGRVQNGRVILEPAFEVDAPPSLPTRAGRHRLQAFGPLGQPLFDFSFDGERPADLPSGSAEHFAFVVPVAAMAGQRPARITVSGAGTSAELSAASASASGDDSPVVERLNARAVRVRWNPASTRGVLVRDPRTGAILAFARGGDAVVQTTASTLDLVGSDGVNSSRRRVGVAPGRTTPRR